MNRLLCGRNVQKVLTDRDDAFRSVISSCEDLQWHLDLPFYSGKAVMGTNERRDLQDAFHHPRMTSTDPTFWSRSADRSAMEKDQTYACFHAFRFGHRQTVRSTLAE